MKRNILTSLILITAVLTSTVKAYGTVDVRQRLLTSAEPAVAIQKLSENNQGVIDPATGTHGGLSASFKITTNSDDSGYDYFLTSMTPTSVPTSAFADIGGLKAIVFVNVENEPTYQDIERAKMGNKLNKNCIAYPITMNIESPMTLEYVPENPFYGNIWQIKTNGGESSNLLQTVGGTPITSTYNIAQDSSGTYQAVVTFTAIAK
ncbi:hypothetical protein IJ750_05810 [bacterium]|nr:hypothetical protein [bacterium]MBR1776569.1 hypothetical protein [bacterium]